MTRALLIITAEHLASARALAQAYPFNLSESQAAEMFVPAGSPTGDAPATHYWVSGLFEAAYWASIQSLAALLPWAECHMYDMDSEPDFPQTRLAAMHLQPMKGEMA